MSGIVIRCPHCGTTQSAIGECEACHEATTRWFCPNHEPGLWLDAPLCPTCGARPGVPGTRPRPTPTPTRPRAPAPSRSTRLPPREAPPPRRTPKREEIYPPETADAEPEVWSGPVYSSGDPRNRDPRFGDVPDAWRLDPSVMLPTAVRVVSLFGCLRRLVMIAIVLLVLFAIAFFGLFGGIILGSETDRRDDNRAESVSAVMGGSSG
jgi:hypothetical protein